jgi:glycosyltransferase involved in cell wall biosynthesis
MSKITVAIPTSEMGGKGAEFLQQSLDILRRQSFTDFDIVITDNSDDDVIENVAADYKEIYGNLTYYRNPNKGMAVNTNAAMNASTGEIIKVLYLDDYLAHDDALKDIVENFKGEWLVTACEHDSDGTRHTTHLPRYNPDIFTGMNTIGSQSVLAVKNGTQLFFDEELTWLLDCDLYKRYFDLYGAPVTVDKVNVVIRQHNEQATNTIPMSRKKWEYDYLIKKYQ